MPAGLGRVSDQWVCMIFHLPSFSRRYTSVQFQACSVSSVQEIRLKVSTAMLSVACTRGWIIS
ncbi:MAG TPA: hypothetical protein ENF21_02300 [Bacteroidetes bacterium]|nr:hypothetical protein [Bacteroidota bacterium]